MKSMENRFAFFYEHLTAGQIGAVTALIAGDKAATYKSAGESLGVSINTIKTHMKRIKKYDPDTYHWIMRVRRIQLDKRHEEALAREDERCHQFHANNLKSWYRQLKMIGALDLLPRKMSRREGIAYINDIYGF